VAENRQVYGVKAAPGSSSVGGRVSTKVFDVGEGLPPHRLDAYTAEGVTFKGEMGV
jgi:hypothetical protein